MTEPIPAPVNAIHFSERGVLMTAALGTMLAPLNSTMIVVALPVILDSFGRSLAWGSWIVVSYLVAMAAVQPLGGSLGDRYGRRRLFILGLTGFLLATIAAALAPTIEWLIAARTVQAICGAAAIPNGTALVRTLIPRGRQGRAFGTIGSGIAIAAAIGPPLGGIVTDTLGWRFIFVANLLLIVPGILLALRLPVDEPQPDTGRFDLRGSALLTTTLVTLALSLTIWRVDGVPLVVAPLMLLVGTLAGFALVRHTRAVERPVLNLSLFARPGFLPATLTVLLSNLAMYTLLLALPVYLKERAGWSTSQVGVLLAGLSVQMIVFSPTGGWLADRLGYRVPAVVGAALMVLGLAPLTLLDSGWSWGMLLGPLVVVGIGIGLSSAPLQASAVEAVPRHETGQASGLFSTMRYLGSILGSAGMAALLVGDVPSDARFHLLFGLLVLAAIGAVATAACLPRRHVADAAEVPVGVPVMRS